MKKFSLVLMLALIPVATTGCQALLGMGAQAALSKAAPVAADKLDQIAEVEQIIKTSVETFEGIADLLIPDETAPTALPWLDTRTPLTNDPKFINTNNTWGVSQNGLETRVFYVQMNSGEPVLRVVDMMNDSAWELIKVRQHGDGWMEFHFMRTLASMMTVNTSQPSVQRSRLTTLLNGPGRSE
jgi:hypothetical protein